MELIIHHLQATYKNYGFVFLGTMIIAERLVAVGCVVLGLVINLL